jgi:hypothetical protein
MISASIDEIGSYHSPLQVVRVNLLPPMVLCRCFYAYVFIMYSKGQQKLTSLRRMSQSQRSAGVTPVMNSLSWGTFGGLTWRVIMIALRVCQGLLLSRVGDIIMLILTYACSE